MNIVKSHLMSKTEDLNHWETYPGCCSKDSCEDNRRWVGRLRDWVGEDVWIDLVDYYGCVGDEEEEDE